MRVDINNAHTHIEDAFDDLLDAGFPPELLATISLAVFHSLIAKAHLSPDEIADWLASDAAEMRATGRLLLWRPKGGK